MGGSREFNGREVFRLNKLHGALASALALGAIHLNVLLGFLSVFVFPFYISVMVATLLLFFTIIPVDEHSKFGARVSSFVCENAASYFPYIVHIEDYDAFDPDRSYVIGYEPHSVLPTGFFGLASRTGFMPLPKLKYLGSSAIFYTPFLRHIWTWVGGFPGTRKNFASNLKAGISCVVVPGGMTESFLMEHGVELVYLKARKGFVRIAIEQGSPLVPVYCFGQSHCFKWWKPKGKLFYQFSRLIKFTPIIFWGVFGSPVPYQTPLHLVVGSPIEVKKNPQPTKEEVDEAHGKFVDALRDLFDKHKAAAGYPDSQLKIL